MWLKMKPAASVTRLVAVVFCLLFSIVVVVVVVACCCFSYSESALQPQCILLSSSALRFAKNNFDSIRFTAKN